MATKESLLISGKIKPMNFTNTEMKIDQIVNYLNDDKIDLSPVFQRGHVWTTALRSSLLKNILSKKPIPAIFLYKEERGSMYTYNILDGKQRVESLILFIASKRPDFKIEKWRTFFSDTNDRKDENFTVKLNNHNYSIDKLPEDIMRDFREYQIPTVEIIMDDNTELDEIISLFVDINQQGVKVKRFDIVKAMRRDSKILLQTYNMVAYAKKAKDPMPQLYKNSITKVIKNLSVIDKTGDRQAKTDKIWEKLTEIAVFSKTKKHVKPSQILKGFINKRDFTSTSLNRVETASIRKAFNFLQVLYRDATVKESPMAKDQIHFYTSVTSIINNNLLTAYTQEELIRKCTAFSKIFTPNWTSPNRVIKSKVKEYLELSKRSTADVDNRNKRQDIFLYLMDAF